ncbi:MAG: hypothetical protein WAL24_08280 [Nitrososphaeraceae archaeon]
MSLIIGISLLGSGGLIFEEFRSHWRRFGITIMIFEGLRRLFRYPPSDRRPEGKLTIIQTEKQRFIQIQNLYEFSKKALYIILPPFVIILILVQVQPLPKEMFRLDIETIFTNPFLLIAPVAPAPISIPIVLNQLSNILVGIAAPTIFYYILARITLWKDYYLFATAWMQIMYEENDPIQKTKYFETGLNYYNAYLKTKLKLEINEDQLYSQLLSKTIEDRNNSLNSISKAFGEHDALKPIAKSSLFVQTPILAREKLESKIKEVVVILVGVIPVIIAVVQAILKLIPTLPSP